MELDPLAAWFIYVLIDPRSDLVRYVGWTSKPTRRLAKHIKHAKEGQQSHRCRWIRAVLEAGLKPVLRFVDQGNGDWQEAEKKWIAYYKAQGASLTNATDGGEGMLGWKHPEEHKARMAERMKGNKHGIGNKSRTGQKLSDEERATLSRAHSTPEARAKASSVRKGKRHSPETIERMRQMRATPEYRAMIAERTKVAMNAPGTKERVSAIIAASNRRRVGL